MRAEGLEKATMRRVAQALDTGQASLYAHVESTAELHSAVLDELLGALPSTSDGTWKDQLETLLRSYSDILFTYPGLARSALLIRPTGPNAVRLYDQILGLLLDGGIAVERAAWGVNLLLLHVTANAAEHSAPTPTEIAPEVNYEAEMSVLAGALRSADPTTTPHVAKHFDALLSGEPSQRAAWALRALIAGIAATPTPSLSATATEHSIN